MASAGVAPEDRKPIVPAVQVSGCGQPAVLKLSVAGCLRPTWLAQWAKENLEPGSVVNSDGLGCFRGPRLADSEHMSPRTAVKDLASRG